jgi:hypothetical protein
MSDFGLGFQKIGIIHLDEGVRPQHSFAWKMGVSRHRFELGWESADSRDPERPRSFIVGGTEQTFRQYTKIQYSTRSTL